MTMVSIPSKDGKTFHAYLAEAPQADAPGIVLIQEIFGVNPALREAADQWAALGFHVVVPDLFWRQEPDVVLDPTVEAEFQRGFAMMQAMKGDETLADLESARAWLAQRLGHERIAALGYCLGGKLAVEVAASSPLKASVSYYGVGLEALVPQVPASAAPLLLHIAAEDRFSDADKREATVRAAEGKTNVTAYVYEGCDHAFARPGGEHFDAAAAKLAQERSLAFLGQHLG